MSFDPELLSAAEAAARAAGIGFSEFVREAVIAKLDFTPVVITGPVEALAQIRHEPNRRRDRGIVAKGGTSPRNRQPAPTAKRTPPAPPATSGVKRHAVTCGCLTCVPPKGVR